MNLDSLTPCRFQCSTATLSLMRLKPHGLACLHYSHIGLETKIAPWTCNSMKPHGLATQTQISSSYCMFFHSFIFIGHWRFSSCTCAHSFPVRFRSSSHPVPIQFRSGSDPVPIRFMSGCLTLRGMMITTYRHHWSHHPQVAFSRNQIPPQIEHHRLHRYI